MKGKIIRGIGGFYYVHVPGLGVYECKAKGIFRNRKIKPLVGDDVEITILQEEEKLGNIEDILERKNVLIRPAVANTDQALVLFAAKDPKPNFNLLDRFLVMMTYQGIHTIVCFNKTDIIQEEEKDALHAIYARCGCDILFISAKKEEGIGRLKKLLEDKTTVLAGPSGVGKSSLVNLLQPEAGMETGAVSEKIKRGRHTTRHSELFFVEGHTYIMDTPGFSSLRIPEMEKEELRDCFPEFAIYEKQCRFQGCQHLQEPGCGVKDALERGKISPVRYENYKILYEEIKQLNKY